MSGTIRQIMPATGWRVVTVTYDRGDCQVHEEPVVCIALLEPLYAERDDGPEQPVVPMIRDRGSYPSKGMGTFDIVIGDEAYWENQRTSRSVRVKRSSMIEVRPSRAGWRRRLWVI